LNDQEWESARTPALFSHQLRIWNLK